jgi:hypothetical protein
MIKKKILSLLIVLAFVPSFVFISKNVQATPLNFNDTNSKGVSVFADTKVNTKQIVGTNIPTVIYPDTNKVAPSTFNPLTAKDNDLKKYGFPSKPKDKKSLLQWEKAMSHAKKHISLSHFSFGNKRHGIDAENNWMGYDCLSRNINNNVLINETFTSFVLPSYNGNNNDDPAIWTGIGGDTGDTGSTSIVQAGADLNATGIVPQNGKSYGGSSKYEFWVEDFPENVIYFPDIKIKPGDTLFVFVSYSYSTTGTSQAYFEDETTGEYGTKNFDGKYYDGSSADAICELTDWQYDGNWPNIQFNANNVGYFTVTGLDKPNGPEQFNTLGNLICNEQILVDNNYTLYGEPSAIDANGGFTIYTYH